MEDVAVAGVLIADARRRAGLTQAALAVRAGIPRPVLNAYERGRRQPSVSMLARLLRATGLELRVAPHVDPARNARRFVDALGLVDAMPRRVRARALTRPVDWARGH